jgi:hypothetical protein
VKKSSKNCRSLPKIFTDITMPAKQSYGPNIGKILQNPKCSFNEKYCGDDVGYTSSIF